MSDQPVIIYHNPKCNTSRTVLAALRERGLEPRVVDYMAVGWTRPLLMDLSRRLGLSPRQMLRTKNIPEDAAGAVAPGADDEAILDAMIAHPVLVERPIVTSHKGAVIARPAERVAEVL